MLSSPAAAFDPLVAALEQNQRLEIFPRPALDGAHYSGYVSLATWNLTGARVSVDVVTAAAGIAETIFAVGTDSNNYYRFVVSGGQLYFQEKVAGALTQVKIAFDAANHRFWRLRHDAGTNQVIFETSPNGVTNWNDRRSVQRRLSLTAARVELGGGTAQSVSAPGKAVFDTFVLNSP